MGAEGLYLGTLSDRSGRAVLDPDHLTTHAVCLGMTGSGKTGLGIVVLEELARRRVPLLVVDLKGDMVDLLLNFPSLAAADFAPWLPADAVAGADRATVAASVADSWREGLAAAGLGSADLRAVRDGVAWQVLTPGVAAAAPLDILPSLSLPPGSSVEADPDGVRERVTGVVSAILSLIGRGGDPLSDRDHVLLATILLEHWRRGDRVDLPRLLGSLVEPPVANLGALPVEVFFPRDERMKLVLELNTLIASPAFAAWTTGLPLTVDNLLGSAAAPRATILCLAHLDEAQRRFVLALVTAELVAWMRRQPAAESLRALLYVDEVQGILPPYPLNPPTKGPLLTLLKQGRAFGVGAWLATQNPVDLDYKALGNAGVKVIGRLLTERDRERALEGLGGGELGGGVDAAVAALGKREFVLVDVRAAERVRSFSSRWAMSYLRGPVALGELGPLLRPAAAAPARASAPVGGAARPPVLATAVRQRFAAAASGLAAPAAVVSVRVGVAKASLGLDRRLDEVWRVPLGAGGGLDLEAATVVDDELDLAAAPPAEMSFPAAAPAGLDAALATLERDFVRFRARTPVLVLANPGLGLAAAAGDTRESFVARCLETADRADDAEQERVRQRYEKRVDTLKRRLAKERDELERDEDHLTARKTEEKLGMVEGLFSVLLGSRSLRSAAGKAASKVRSAATQRRMRQGVEGQVVESEREIERLEDEIEALLTEMQDEVERIARASEERAAAVEEVAVRPKTTDVVVTAVELVWSSD